MKKFFLLFSLILALNVNAEQKKILSTTYNDSVLSSILCEKDEFTPVPRYGDDYWKSLPKEMRDSYISHGEQYLNQNFISLPISLFSDFRTNGDRERFQNVIFPKRNQLISLVMAEIMEGEGRFMPDILNGVYSVCEETWWGIPAHYGPKVPVPADQAFDLFNAETGGMMAWIYYMMKEPMDKFSPLVSKRMEDEITRRILEPGLHGNEWWRRSAMNWNPWICSNWLACVLFVEKDADKRKQHVLKIQESLDNFIDGYPDDGGCDEGAHYWDRAAGSLCDNLWLLNKATSGNIDLSNNRKIKEMGAFLCKMNIGNGFGVNFADTNNKLSPYINVVYPAGLYLKDENLCSFAADIAAQQNYFEDPAKVFYEYYLAMFNRELVLLSNIGTLKDQKAETKLLFDSYLPRIQVLTARSRKNSSDGLFLAAKGGHNGESHNHNDVGSFIVYADCQPLLIDPGVGYYTKETFNDATRYNIWTMQSGYHNLPRINGVDQRNGAQFTAKNVSEKINNSSVTFNLDIAGAYPDNAQVESWVRNIDFKRNKYIEITEDYALKQYVSPSEIILMTPSQPELQNGKVILSLGNDKYAVTFDPSLLTATFEEVDLSDDKLRKTWNKLYRIKLSTKSDSLKGKVKYKIFKI